MANQSKRMLDQCSKTISSVKVETSVPIKNTVFIEFTNPNAFSMQGSIFLSVQDALRLAGAIMEVTEDVEKAAKR